MNTPTCSQCAAAIEALSELNRVDGQLLCWNCLVPNPNERWKVTVRWEKDLPTVKEIGQLRSLVPAYQEKTSKQLWQSLKSKSEVVVGEFYKPHLDQLLSRNKKIGLRLDVRNTLKDEAKRPAFERIQLAIQRDDADHVMTLAEQLPNINELTEDGSDLLSYSIDAGSQEAAGALIRAGIDLANSRSTVTAMQIALENGVDSIIDALLEKEIDLNCQGTDEDANAIHLLCRYYRSSTLLERFLKNGADPRSVDDAGQTPLMILQMSLDRDGGDPEIHAMMELLNRATKAS